MLVLDGFDIIKLERKHMIPDIKWLEDKGVIMVFDRKPDDVELTISEIDSFISYMDKVIDANEEAEYYGQALPYHIPDEDMDRYYALTGLDLIDLIDED